MASVIDTIPPLNETFLLALTKIGGKRVGFAFLKYINIYLSNITSYSQFQQYKNALSIEERNQLTTRFLAFIENWHYSLRESAINKMTAFITRGNKINAVKRKIDHEDCYHIPMTRFRSILYEYRLRKNGSII